MVFTAAILWGFAGYKLTHIAWKALKDSVPDYRVVIPLILAGWGLFLYFVFIKTVRKHVSRIVNKKNEYNCLFSFLDIKGYFLMAVMITGGIILRKSEIVPLIPLGVVYGIMGLTLFTSALIFLFMGTRFKYYRKKYFNE